MWKRCTEEGIEQKLLRSTFGTPTSATTSLSDGSHCSLAFGDERRKAWNGSEGARLEKEPLILQQSRPEVEHEGIEGRGSEESKRLKVLHR